MLSLRDRSASLNHAGPGRGSGSANRRFDSAGAATYLECKPSQPGIEPRARAPYWALRTRGPIVRRPNAVTRVAGRGRVPLHHTCSRIATITTRVRREIRFRLGARGPAASSESVARVRVTRQGPGPGVEAASATRASPPGFDHRAVSDRPAAGTGPCPVVRRSGRCVARGLARFEQCLRV